MEISECKQEGLSSTWAKTAQSVKRKRMNEIKRSQNTVKVTACNI